MSAETDRLAQIKASALMDEPGGSFVVALAERLLTQVEALTAERDALAAAHASSTFQTFVMDDIEGSDPTTWERLRAALADSEADTSDVDVCSGDADCTSALHVHGCFADTAGPCTDPDEHQSTDQETHQ